MSLHFGGFFIQKERAEESPFHRPKNRSYNDQQKIIKMILDVKAKLNEIFKQGRDYPWKKPNNCPCCKTYRLWGHGFVTRFFDNFIKGLLLRRYRCPDCGCVIVMKPYGYFRRFQASVRTIRYCISERIRTGRWPPGLSGPRRRHWLSALKRKALAYYGVDADLLHVFDALLKKQIIAVSRSI